MSGITDELRDWAHEHLYKSGIRSDLLAIADRIDAEHERQLEVLYRDMSDAEWVRLPNDAEDVPIHIGDVMESKGSGLLFDKASFEVRAMRYDECGWEVYDRLGDRYAPSLICHYHAPTVEDVLREFANEVYADADNEIRDRDFLCAKYAKRLTLAEGEDA